MINMNQISNLVLPVASQMDFNELRASADKASNLMKVMANTD